MLLREVAVRALLVAALAPIAGRAAAVELQVVSLVPTRNTIAAPVATSVAVEFDRALNPATITASSFRVFGRYSGTKSGSFAFSNGNKTVTLSPAQPFSAGEVVLVNLSNTIAAADATPMRAGGYAFQFTAATVPSQRSFNQVDVLSNRDTNNAPTRIYGALASDYNGDGFLDLGTVNEVSGDVRVFLNRADGSGQYNDFRDPVPIGFEASPNEPGDFNNDGKADAVISASTSESVWVLLGAGNGDFSSTQGIDVGNEPHGVAVLDVDGDGDLDIVNANHGSNDLGLLINNGSGSFSTPTFFDSGLDGEYGINAGDVNNDGLTDVVVGGRDDQQIRALLGNGNGTFTPAAVQSSGGATWVVVLGDVNGDGNLDATMANSFTGNGAVALGNGDGTFAAPTTISLGAHTVSTDLGDLDGDGDLDWVLSSFGGGFWRVYTNNGSGVFTFDQEITALSNPSCAILYDADNDGDLDLALSDEISDVLMLMENLDASLCSPTPLTCRAPVVSGKSSLTIKDNGDDTRDSISWSWTKGATTTKAEFGSPKTTDNYELCLYHNNALIQGQGLRIPAAGTCANHKACWKDVNGGYGYADSVLTPDGVRVLKLKEALTPDTAKIRLTGKGARLAAPDLTQLTGTVAAQLQHSSSALCWGATFSPPFVKNDGVTFRDKSD